MPSYPAILPAESAQAYEAAQAYFDMGADRNVRDVAQKLNKSLTLIGRWSSQHDWVLRARSYDIELSALAAEQHQTHYLADLEAHRIRASEAGKGLYAVAAKLLQRLNREIEQLELTPATLMSLRATFQTALDLESHALGIDRMDDERE